MLDDSFYETLVARMPVGVTVTQFPTDDPRQGVLIAANPAASDVLGLDLRPFIGVPADPTEVADDLDDAETDRVLGLSYEVATTGVNQQLDSFEIAHGPAKGHYRVDVFALGERRAASSFHRIDSELGAVETLEWSMRTLETTNEDLSRFATQLAHDLRNPLTGISGNAQLLQMLAVDLAPSARNALERIVELTELSTSMIADLLRYVQRPSTSWNDAVSLADVVTWVHDVLTEQLATTGATMTHDRLGTVAGHEAPIRQVFLNLVSNSLRYRRPDRPLTLSINTVSAPDDLGPICIEVIDNGRGIPEHEKEQVFDWGYRSVRSAASTAGTGIGLAASRAMLANLGASIFVGTPPEHGGTRMCVTFLPPRPTSTS